MGMVAHAAIADFITGYITLATMGRLHVLLQLTSRDIFLCHWLGLKYLGLVIGDEGSKPETLSRIAQTTAVLTSLKPVWNDRNISLSSKIRLVSSLVTSIFLYACESWTLTAELQRRIQAMEMRCYHKILRISYKDHVTNEEVHAKIQQAIGPHKDLTIVKRHRLH